MKLLLDMMHRKCGSTLTGPVYERCVLCGKETNVPVDLPIAQRSCYEEGGGQLCRSCWQKLYGK